jgi:hypothetical protein
MTNDDIEKILRNVPRPYVIAGSHRSDLKSQLLQTPQYRRRTMIAKKWKMMIATCCGLLLLAALGAAGKQGYNHFIVGGAEVIERGGPNGFMHGETRTAGADKPESPKAPHNLDESLQKAISQGHYKLIRRSELSGYYYYEVTHDNGFVTAYGSQQPLPDKSK